jgi:hypothetical protein
MVFWRYVGDYRAFSLSGADLPLISISIAFETGITLLKGGEKGEYYAIRSGILNMTLARQPRRGIQPAAGALRANDCIICAGYWCPCS